MSAVAAIAFGAISALGEGRDAAGVGSPGDAAKVAIARDGELEREGLARPLVARVSPDALPLPRGVDRARGLLDRALAACAEGLDRARPGWKSERIGLALGTSSGGMRAAEGLFSVLAGGGAADAPAGATYFAPMAQAAGALGLKLKPATLVLTACAASTLAIGIGARWVEAGACDVVLAGGFDAVSVFVASGFEVLRATTGAIPPRPFRVGRDGMSLGEGAAIVALAAGAARRRVYGHVLGFGASSDAVHLTAPDRTGDGLARAAARALADAGVDRAAIDLVSAHATATDFNDAAEAKAIARALGPDASPVVHPLKAQIGHTLGAAGALESLACLDAIDRGVLPASAADGPIEPSLPGRLLARAEGGGAGRPRLALKLSAAFGGANAALVWGGAELPPGVRAPRARRPAYVTRAATATAPGDAQAIAELAGRTDLPVERLQRADGLVRAAVAALVELQAAVGPLRGAGIVVGHALATIETNYVYHSRMRARGPRAAEPRRFPYTSPNAVAGECGVAFGLTGPGLAVGSGLHGAVEALAVAALLVEMGDADRVVVLGVDEVGPASRAVAPAFGPVDLRSGAIALLVTAEPTGYARVGDVELRLDPELVRPRSAALPGAPGDAAPRDPRDRRDPRGERREAVGHRALLPLAAATPPREVRAETPAVLGGARGAARVELLTVRAPGR